MKDRDRDNFLRVLLEKNKEIAQLKVYIRDLKKLYDVDNDPNNHN